MIKTEINLNKKWLRRSLQQLTYRIKKILTAIDFLTPTSAAVLSIVFLKVLNQSK